MDGTHCQQVRVHASMAARWLNLLQVFRTYNASITLDALLHKESTAATVDERKAEYDRANKEVRTKTNQHPDI